MNDLDKLMAEAEDAFWNVFCYAHPEVKTGDISVGTMTTLKQAMRKAVTEWYETNKEEG